MLSTVRLSLVCLSVMFVHTTQPVEMFGKFSTPFGILAIHWPPQKIFTDIVPGETVCRGFKRKRGSQNSDFQLSKAIS